MENKLRLRFSKTDKLRFIGHLDFLRVFQQMIRRSGLPIAYSQGFNPHQIVSFALPLPLGTESIHDYADITLTVAVPSNEIVQSLNAAAPGGLRILAAYPVEGANAASATIAADYVIDLECPDKPRLQHSIERIMQSETLIIPKKTKSGIKDTDIRPDIFAIDTFSCPKSSTHITKEGLKMRLSAGSARFLNPMLVAEQIFETVPRAISRVELYQSDGAGAFKPL